MTNVVVQRLDKLPLGAGEPPICPIPAAIANAFFDATGVRIREAPMTPVRVRADAEGSRRRLGHATNEAGGPFGALPPSRR